MLKIFSFAVSAFLVLLLWQETFAAKKNKGQADKSEESAVSDQDKQAYYVDPPSLPISENEKNAICKQYEGKLIEYYGKVFRVKSCLRYQLTAEQIYQMSREKVPIVEVSGKIVEALAFAGDLSSPKNFSRDICQRLEGKYVFYFPEKMYFVKNCKKILFPDNETFANHRGKLTSAHQPVYLAEEEISLLADGGAYPSDINNEFKALLSSEQAPDVLPITDACKGLVDARNSKIYTTYLDQVWLVTYVPNKQGLLMCEKKLVDAEEFTRGLAHQQVKLLELSSSQAISIPDKVTAKE